MPTVEQQQLKKSAAANGSALLKAVSAKQYPRAKALLQAGAETTWHGTDSGYYAIHYAIAANSDEGNDMLLELLNYKANPNSQLLEYYADSEDDCIDYATPLHTAVQVGNATAIRLLLDAKADCSKICSFYDCDDETPIVFAANQEKWDLVALFLEHPNATDTGSYGYILLRAVKAQQYEVAEKLLLAGAATTYYSWFPERYYFPIHYAIAANSTAGNNMLQILLNHQADPNSQYLEYAFSDDSDDSDENPCIGWITPLHLAVEVENTAAITLLLNAKASCSKTYKGQTPIQYAAQQKKWGLVALFIDHPNTTDNGNYGGILLNAVKAKQYPLAQKLLQAGTKTTWYFPTDGYYAIHCAIAANSDEGNDILKTLLAKGADPNSQHKDFITPLPLAIMAGNTTAVELLLRAGADRNKTYEGLTPAQYAARRSELKIRKLFADEIQPAYTTKQLLAATSKLRTVLADLGQLQDFLKKAPEITSKAELPECIKDFIQRFPIAKYESQYNDLLALAIKSSNLAAIQLLLVAGINPNLQYNDDDNYITPLHLAIEVGKTAAVQLLLDANASLDKTYKSLTPVQYAIQKSQWDILKRLTDKLQHTTPKVEQLKSTKESLQKVLVNFEQLQDLLENISKTISETEKVELFTHIKNFAQKFPLAKNESQYKKLLKIMVENGRTIAAQLLLAVGVEPNLALLQKASAATRWDLVDAMTPYMPVKDDNFADNPRFFESPESGKPLQQKQQTKDPTPLHKTGNIQ